MAVAYPGLPVLLPVAGVRVATVAAGIKYADRRDLVLFELCEGSTVAGVFTRNAFCAAPVVRSRDHLAEATPRYWLINTGNANAGTGEKGAQDALHTCEQLAKVAGCATNQVLPFSTGVIGEPLPVAKIVAAMPKLLGALTADGWKDAAHGIMTTDTVPKGATREVVIGGKTVRFTGISKGAGMIRPNMATMLGFVACDAAVEASTLQLALSRAADKSFNCITIDGDTSTNDSCMLVATGRAGNALIDDHNSDDYAIFEETLISICEELAKLIVRDGEGATKFITVNVNQGINEVECEEIAYAIAHSPLVKTAFFASDPNWGRILAAIGRANVPALDLDTIDVYLDDVCIVRNGGRAADYTEQAGQTVMKRQEITIRVELGRGSMSATVWTCDFSYDYVRINAEYRS
ncbi:MAG: bifunctional glutamate N-acetyltransferase/amino-acid acetyltransferase ArgJ [Gammaproteobacteria bacterium]|nr:bifunctional glutamate N-acetyltransferase/amino-acid acetyltransferase ArgJ [Gammaproteobacteria bacterium]